MVCSQHFVDGCPTLANPIPFLHLGYEATRKKPRRALICVETEKKPELSEAPTNPEADMTDKTVAECRQTNMVANLMIHVERAINRIKEFKLLKNTMPIDILPLADYIIKVCAALCNIQPPLIRNVCKNKRTLN